MVDLDKIWLMEEYENDLRGIIEPDGNMENLVLAVGKVMKGMTLSSSEVQALVAEIRYYDYEAKDVVFAKRMENRAVSRDISSHLLLFGIKGQFYAVFYETCIVNGEANNYGVRFLSQMAHKLSRDEYNSLVR